MKEQVECSRGISFVDNVTWVVKGDNINGVAQHLERCVAASLRWAEGNAVQFEASKTGAVLFSRKKERWQTSAERPFRLATRQYTSPGTQHDG